MSKFALFVGTLLLSIFEYIVGSIFQYVFKGALGGALGPEEGPGRSQGDFYIQNVGLGGSFWGQNEAKSAQKCTPKIKSKNDSRKRRLAAPFWTILRSFLGGFL